VLAAPPDEVFKAWLSPDVPGTPWNAASDVVLNPKEGGVFFVAVGGRTPIPHFGRFLAIEPSKRIHHTWMSPNTSGMESRVTVAFKKVGTRTHMTLVHSGLPNTAAAKGYKDGWNYFLNIFEKQVGSNASETQAGAR
jgi:uncharacterized protein YndB with AHSA1/START domain